MACIGPYFPVETVVFAGSTCYMFSYAFTLLCASISQRDRLNKVINCHNFYFL